MMAMLGKKIEDAFNEQINWELYSGYLYLSMSAYFLSINLNGFANWMRVQALEELTHAMKFFDFINERSGRVALLEAKSPPKEWESPLGAFEDAYEHECFVSSRINDLVNLSLEEKDHASNNFLQWFVAEQVEEEASVDEVAQKLKIIGGDGGGLFMLDQELAQRVFTPPAAAE
jgi:ferritin